MIPVISIVSSRSNIGKTTAICKIILELKSRGYRVATIKHHGHDFEIDKPGKDTFLHAEAGADIVVLSSPKKMALIEKREREYSLDSIIDKIKDVDIILTEGYKDENKPKIEVFRKEMSGILYSSDDELFAIITDAHIEKNIPQFALNDVSKLVDLIEKVCLKNNHLLKEE